MRWLTGIFLLGLACNGTATAELACDNLCDCLSATPIAEQTCITICVPEIEAEALDATCLNCIAFSSCDEFAGPAPCDLECPTLQIGMEPQ